MSLVLPTPQITPYKNPPYKNGPNKGQSSRGHKVSFNGTSLNAVQTIGTDSWGVTFSSSGLVEGLSESAAVKFAADILLTGAKTYSETKLAAGQLVSNQNQSQINQ